MEEHSRTTILIQKSEPTIICNTLSRYNIDISAISETHLIGVSQIEEIREGYTIFWPGKDNDESGVRLIIKSDIASLLDLSVPSWTHLNSLVEIDEKHASFRLKTGH